MYSSWSFAICDVNTASALSHWHRWHGIGTPANAGVYVLELALSLGPEPLGARLAVVRRETSGRVNRAFEDVTQDGQIYCYGPTVEGFAPSSWFLALMTGTEVRMEHIDHGPGESPCDDDPATWSFTAAAVSMVR